MLIVLAIFPDERDVAEIIRRGHQVGVWTSFGSTMTELLSQATFQELGPPLFVWDRWHCLYKDGKQYKPLQIICNRWPQYRVEDVILVDASGACPLNVSSHVVSDMEQLWLILDRYSANEQTTGHP